MKEDFELHGKRIKKGAVILASLMYAKGSDPRVSAGDHADSPLPRHMDIANLTDSFRPERWLDDSNKLDTSVRSTAVQLFLCCTEPIGRVETAKRTPVEVVIALCLCQLLCTPFRCVLQRLTLTSSCIGLLGKAGEGCKACMA